MKIISARNDRGEPEVFLYYKAGDWPDMWFLNNAFGAVQGYAWIDADGQKCPELLQHQWKWQALLKCLF